ncbi:MAG: DNA-formamidopyrimidine glycosylase family protein [Phycisphaerae bacterium]
MPELPDICTYIRCLESRIVGQPLARVAIRAPFLLRTVEPPIDACVGRTVRGVRRIGKRIAFELDDDSFVVFHLMIAGRFRWQAAAPPSPVARRAPKIELARFNFPSGTLALTEAGPRKRASLHVVRGAASLTQFDRGGLDTLTASADEFAAALRRENHTLKRALTDPRLFSGIGNAYSDEILHAARLSPVTLSARLPDADCRQLHAATRDTLQTWIDRLAARFATRFPGPGDVTAFRPEFAVHGRFGQACPACAAPVQRIRYADHETNYCPGCQTGGRILADRSLSRLLRADWPRTLDELEGPAP